MPKAEKNMADSGVINAVERENEPSMATTHLQEQEWNKVDAWKQVFFPAIAMNIAGYDAA